MAKLPRKKKTDTILSWKIKSLITGDMPEASGEQTLESFMWKHPNKNRFSTGLA